MFLPSIAVYGGVTVSSVIKHIECGSPAEKTDLCVGDVLKAVNGHFINDVLDYKYYTYDSLLKITALSPEGNEKHVRIKKREGADLGLEFGTYLMDEPCSCANECIFCFIDQLPAGMRSTLYFKDDDARLSFLTGNYVTLTNMTEREIKRICDLKISPINVSVHTTNPRLRSEMLRNTSAGEGLEIMRRFAGAGIVMNCQIVCCPGINDGEELMSSMCCLEKMYPAVRSVSIVPVGLTRHRAGLPAIEAFCKETAESAVELVENFSEECLLREDSRIFFCADELYLLAGRDIPEDEFYEDYPQLENGVGMLRLFETEFIGALGTVREDSGKSIRPFSTATGEAAAPFIERLISAVAEKFARTEGRAYAVKNCFFGESVNVAGLVTGRDLIRQLVGKSLGERLLIPQTMLRYGEGVFLDDVTLDEISAALGVPVIPVPANGEEFLKAILEV